MLTQEDFITRAKALYGNQYDYSKVVYKNSAVKVCITCPEHGDFWTTPNSLLQGHKCPTCSGRQRITREVFLSRAQKKHNNRYDYSKVEYHGASKEVCIVCPVHGEFWQIAKYHLQGNGCPECYGTPKSNTEEFIRKANSIYGEIYDYSKVDYKGNKEKVCITCPEHGEWWTTPNNFLRGHSCPGCFGTPRHTTDEFIEKARAVHGNKYDYSKVDYQGNKKDVCIICPVHGEFWQKPAIHWNGNGCSKCSGMALITQETFIKRSTERHKGKYDYTKVQYNGRQDKVCIICPEHGVFWQNPHYHMYGGNCPKCVGGVRLTKETFIEKARAIHGGKYDYSKVEYVNYSKKVCIICPDHGEFWQVPNNHLYGAGCPVCPQSQMEGAIRELLIRNNVKFEQEKEFDWLVYKSFLFLDFFLPEYNVAIECQGGQHFYPTDIFGGEDEFQITFERDKVKRELCEKHGIKVLYYTNAHLEEYPYPVYESQRDLLKTILKNIPIVIPQEMNDQLEFLFDEK